MVIINQGRVVASGSPAELVGAGDRLSFRARPGLVPEVAGLAVTEGPPGHYTATGEVDPQAVAALTAWFAGAGVLVEDLRLGGGSLEEVFVQLTGGER